MKESKQNVFAGKCFGPGYTSNKGAFHMLLQCDLAKDDFRRNKAGLSQMLPVFITNRYLIRKLFNAKCLFFSNDRWMIMKYN